MDRMFIHCAKCGKRLIERKPNGLFVFMFGKNGNSPAVYIEIHGSVKIKCFRPSCGHLNVINFFPEQFKATQEVEHGKIRANN